MISKTVFVALSIVSVGCGALFADRLTLDGRALEKPGWPSPFSRIDSERSFDERLEAWKENVKNVRSEIHRAALFSERRRHLKRTAEYLRDELERASAELAHLKQAPDSEWRHLASHLDALLSDMRHRYEARFAE